ncbi:conserved hypothetical protein [Anaeromyxobacter sp. K]|uniref:multiheme c-type cytochrome n=1 Tax=Anaeromyxobacter sp. (strain K) TaxID=447217 RepID=UPI00015F84DF|nr:cytochrome c3 family protein [Anaeromyxobacter sp. K]ACG71679.1 conserved hypothetical protein [Anaeromyxobacter sp. K]
MQNVMRYSGALFFAGVLALAGCKGSDGDVGPQGPAGQDGQAGQPGQPGQPGQDLTATAKPESCSVCHGSAGGQHQAIYDNFTDGLDPATSKLQISNITVVSVPGTAAGTFDSTLTFNVTVNGQPYTAGIAALKQKRFTATEFDTATNTFTTATAFSWGTPAHVANGQYTATKTAAAFAPEASNAFVYLYLGDKLILPAEGHYNLMDNVASAGVTYGTWSYTSAANVAGCEKCHPAPYAKHGYRQATVNGLQDMVACKACHTDQREGTDFVFQILGDDPAAAAALQTDESGETIYSADQMTKYAYTATIVNDTHMSHAMEFPYPQSMANCVTCHEGKLDLILTDANFTVKTCKSCHPVTGTGANAPALKDVVSVMPYHPTDFYATQIACNDCHKAGGIGPVFSVIHTGYNKAIYKDAATKYATAITSAVSSATFDSATNKLTVKFTVTGADADALVKPTVVAGLYGYGTKDMYVSGHNGQADGTRNLEWSEGAVQRGDPTKSANSDRLTVTPATAAAGQAEWTAVADLTLWANLIADGTVQKVEIAFLPVLGLDQGAAVSATNAAIAVAGKSVTFDLAANAIVPDADAYGKAIVNTAKCNACHESLGTTFHSPSYGSAGVVACRICHTPRDGGSHLEMQSRSIDSYVHAIHSFQVFDVAGVDFANPVEKMEYEHHIGSAYPNFTILNCKSCHEDGTFEVPDQTKSLPGVFSKAAANTSWDRTIGAVPMYVSGPASRACGSCHRSQDINADAASDLASFNQHAATFGFLLETSSATAGADYEAAIAKIFSIFN